MALHVGNVEFKQNFKYYFEYFILMAIIWTFVTPDSGLIGCGDNNHDGTAIATALDKSRARAKSQVFRETMALRNARWRDLRRFRCPQGDCRRKVISYVRAPSPEYVFRQLEDGWLVIATRKWNLTIRCKFP